MGCTGIDISSALTEQNFSCLKDAGEELVVIRAWCSYGGVDSNAVYNIEYASVAGMDQIDVYMFPCRGLSAQNQVDDMMNALGASKTPPL